MAIKVRALFVMLVVLATMWLSGCGHYSCGTTFGNASCSSTGGGLNQGGGGGNNIGLTAFVYFIDDVHEQVSAEGLNVADSQNYAPVIGFATPVLPIDLGADGGVVIVNKQFLYIPFANGAVYGFAIDPTSGALTPVPGSTMVTGSGTAVAADPSGKVLFVGGTAGISTFTINANDGSLTATGSFATGGIVPTELVTDGLGRFVYALTGSTITAFSYTSAGALVAVAGSPFSFSTTMSQIVGEKSGKYLLGVTGGTGAGGGAVDNNIYIFTIAQSGLTGALSQFGSPVPTSFSPVFLAVSPNGSFVYTFNQGATAGSGGTVIINDPMEGFAFNSSTGALTEVTGSPFTDLSAEIGRFDQSGQYLFSVADVPNSSFGGVFAYGVDTSSGALSSTLDHAGVPSLSYAVTDEP